ncbi:MAG: hypothetical protein ACKOZY_00915, partial [Flavobacteriales bacterium]
AFIAKAKQIFHHHLLNPDTTILTYSRIVTSQLFDADIRISPRRARMLARNLVALFAVVEASEQTIDEQEKKALFKLALTWSLPQRAYALSFQENIIDAAHSEAIRMALKSNLEDRWVGEFVIENSLATKIDMLFQDQISMDIKSLGVMELLRKNNPISKAIFAFATQPALLKHKIINQEALHELSKIAQQVQVVHGDMAWDEKLNENNTIHPIWEECLKVLDKINESKVRTQRAKQIFYYLILQGEKLFMPNEVEKELNSAFHAMHKISKGLKEK